VKDTNPLARSRRLRAGVAAGHPATCEAGVEIMEEGGSAADAAVAACLASCVAETVMTGLLGGGHAVYWDGLRVRNLDSFVTVPSGQGGEMLELQVPFGAELVHYAVGPASFAVPGVPAGLGELWRGHGRLPWARLVDPAIRLALNGVPMPPAHVRCLEMLAPVMTMNEGARMYAPGGKLLSDGEQLRQPGLVRALELLRDEGPASVYTGSIAETIVRLCDERGGLVTRDDLAGYEARWTDPLEVEYAGTRFLTRGGLAGVAETLARLAPLRGSDEAERVPELVRAFAGADGPEGHTTNLVTVDREGNACVLTTSLGLGSGDWLPGLDLHLNSMLGEVDLVRGRLEPGERMDSMMAPSLAFDAEGPALAIGSAGGTRLRTALVGVAAGILDEGLEPQAAVDRPRVHPVGAVVNAEPGIGEDALGKLEAQGWSIRAWPDRHHYFGGVSVIGRSGPAADPRRSGAARALPWSER
jgi:gamma-glutamyltranspeptidase/glutathione hydrolase